MEIKCKRCNKIPKIEIFDDIQSIRFICDDSFSHFGMLSVNNFYKNLVVNNCDENIKEFISSYKQNINNINHDSSLYYFIKFQKKFELLLNNLKNEYQDLIDQFNKILFIKKELFNKIENNNNPLNEDNNNIYLNNDIINSLEGLISLVKDKKIIKEKYPKIIKNEEMTNEIKEILSQNQIQDFKKNLIDFEFYNYTFNKPSINIKKVKYIEFIEGIDFKLNKKLLLLNDKSSPSKILFSYSLEDNNYLNFYNSNLQKLFNILFNEKIYDIYQIKEGSIILIGNNINIIDIDIINKTYKIKQTFNCNETSIKILEIFYDNRVSILMCFGYDIIFYLMKDNFNSNIYTKINIDSTQIKAKNLFSFNNNNMINITYGQVDLYRIHHFYDKDNNFQMKIENNGSIIIKEFLNSSIYYINDDKFVVSGKHKLFLISLSEKDIISIYEERFEINNIFSGFHGELYLYLNKDKSLYISDYSFKFNYDSISFLKQINFDNHGIYEVGYIFIENIDKLNFTLIDLDDNIYYIWIIYQLLNINSIKFLKELTKHPSHKTFYNLNFIKEY